MNIVDLIKIFRIMQESSHENVQVVGFFVQEQQEAARGRGVSASFGAAVMAMAHHFPHQVSEGDVIDLIVAMADGIDLIQGLTQVQSNGFQLIANVFNNNWPMGSFTLTPEVAQQFVNIIMAHPQQVYGAFSSSKLGHIYERDMISLINAIGHFPEIFNFIHVNAHEIPQLVSVLNSVPNTHQSVVVDIVNAIITGSSYPSIAQLQQIVLDVNALHHPELFQLTFQSVSLCADNVEEFLSAIHVLIQAFPDAINSLVQHDPLSELSQLVDWVKSLFPTYLDGVQGQGVSVAGPLPLQMHNFPPAAAPVSSSGHQMPAAGQQMQPAPPPPAAAPPPQEDVQEEHSQPEGNVSHSQHSGFAYQLPGTEVHCRGSYDGHPDLS